MPFPKLQQIQNLQQEINSHGKLGGDILKAINYKFRLEWNYNSNIMEGNSLTRQETRSVMTGNITVGGKPLKDIMEMKGHDDVVKEIMKMGQGELNLSESRLKEIHKLIMYEEAPKDQEKIGIWKTENNYLYNYKGERVDFLPAGEVKERMHSLMNWLGAEKEKISRNDKTSLHPIELAFKFHLDYITIHPFYDGNGRTARILTNLILVAYGYPPLYIKLDEKDRYYQYLADVQEYGGNPDLFYDFMGDLLIRSQQLVLNAIAGKPVEEPDDIDKEIAMWKKGLGEKNIEGVTKSEEIIFELYKNSISRLFDFFIRKYKQFEDLFIWLSIEGRINDHTGEDKAYVDKGVDEYYFMYDGTYEFNLNIVALVINLKGFKKNGTEDFDLHASITCSFHRYKWHIQINDYPLKIEKLYTEILTEDEMIEIVNGMVKQTFESIKQKVSKD